MIEDKLNELNLIEIDENSPLYEYRYRINKYTNAVIKNEISSEHFDELLLDLDEIKLNLNPEDSEKSELIKQIKEEIKELL